MVEYVSGLLCDVLDVALLRRACERVRYADRVYDYQVILKDACRRVFRWYDGGVSVFRRDLGVWVGVVDSVLKSALRRSFDELVGHEYPVTRSDMVNGEGKLLAWMRDGAMENPLGVSPSVVGFRNCVVDFGDVSRPVVHRLDEGLPVVRLLPYDYDPRAACPLWESFLHGILPANDIVTLQKYLGLGCVQRSAMRHKIEETLWLVGSGANGKSTIRNVVVGVFGDWNIEDLGMDYLTAPATDSRLRTMARLEHKIFNYASEMQSYDIRKGMDVFKSLCSGEPQLARRLGSNVTKIYDIPFFIFNTNVMPDISEGDDAFWRRLVKIRFRTSVSERDMDRELDKKLAAEYSGIRNWCMRGYRMLLRDNFRFKGEREKRNERIQDMAEAGDTPSLFRYHYDLRGNVRSGHWEEKPQYVRAQLLFNKYLEYCEGESLEPLSVQAFGRALRKMGIEKERRGSGYYYRVYCDKKLDFGLCL